jgi:desulfoferrodoxin (superoxide reductase-like protein)
MKKLILSVSVCLFLSLIVKADPPKKIAITYTSENKTLKIEVFHPVQNIEKHYIDLISVEVNGKEVKSLKFLKQSDKKGETAELIISEIVNGSNVTVRATCNEFGSKKITKKL